MRNLVPAFSFALFLSAAHAQKTAPVIFNRSYNNVEIRTGDSLVVPMHVKKATDYQVLVQQQGIDVMLILKDSKGNTIREQDAPNGSHGLEIIDHTAAAAETYTLTIKKFEQEGNANTGQVSYYVKEFTPQEMAVKEETKKALAAENRKHVLTLDIDHFWEAYDKLESGKTYWDSILAFQNLYFDRATNGMKDFIAVRQWSPELFVQTMRKLPKYYASVRPYTYRVGDAAFVVEDVFNNFQRIYGNFKPFAVCFAIGYHNTGGTVSNGYILLGTEMVMAGKNVDFSELDSTWKPDPAKPEIEVANAIRSIVAHECVHTQQPARPDSNAVVCGQLYASLREGAGNFIGELLTGNTNYSAVNKYGDAHEAALWNEFKASLCSSNGANWLYNGSRAIDRPADLGYYIGYKICQAYYNNAADKSQAIKDIIEIRDPLSFLQKSGYDRERKR